LLPLPCRSPVVSVVLACPPDGSPEDQFDPRRRMVNMCTARVYMPYKACTVLHGRARESAASPASPGDAPHADSASNTAQSAPSARAAARPSLSTCKAMGKRPPPVVGVTQSADGGLFSSSIKPPTPTPTYVDVYCYSIVESGLTDLSLLMLLRRGRRGRQVLPSRLRPGEGLVICSAQPRNVALDYTRQAMRSEGRAPLARRLHTRESGARRIVIDQQRQSTASRNLPPAEDSSAGSPPLSRVHSHTRASSREAYAGNVLAPPSSCSTAVQNPTTGSARTTRVPAHQNVSTSEVH
jgi:hypothetical protein